MVVGAASPLAMATSPLPNKLEPLMVFREVPLTRVGCLPSSWVWMLPVMPLRWDSWVAVIGEAATLPVASLTRALLAVKLAVEIVEAAPVIVFVGEVMVTVLPEEDTVVPPPP